ncbi:DUF1661 domain-containing protein [Porphyromonas gingivalis]|uniref:DUF1661 domain-containing protein n=1 Tax=Porphyromonas gingivalis TaxID=837 RepID=UPI003525942C
MARELFRFGSGRKKFSRRFSRKHAPQSEQLWFEKIRSEYIRPRARGVSYEALPTASIATITTAISEAVRAKKSKQ